MIQMLRWAVFLPAALIASVLAGAAGNWFAEFSGASAWYIWLVSGALSGAAFFVVAGKIVPRRSQFAKWLSVLIVGALGTMSALGPLIQGQERPRALAGLAMVLIAISQARAPQLGSPDDWAVSDS
jgi:hypothetical protein